MTTVLNEIEKFFREDFPSLPTPLMPSSFQRPGGGLSLYPVSDEVDGKHIMKFPLPGVPKEDVHVKVVDGNQVVVGYAKQSKDGRASQTRIYAARLPRSADPTTATARTEDGVVIVEFDAREGLGEIEVKID